VESVGQAGLEGGDSKAGLECGADRRIVEGREGRENSKGEQGGRAGREAKTFLLLLATSTMFAREIAHEKVALGGHGVLKLLRHVQWSDAISSLLHDERHACMGHKRTHTGWFVVLLLLDAVVLHGDADTGNILAVLVELVVWRPGGNDACVNGIHTTHRMVDERDVFHTIHGAACTVSTLNDDDCGIRNQHRAVCPGDVRHTRGAMR